jgi:thiamine biosynthesis protein ThiI
MSALLLVRYGELALKSPPVRREFESTLRRNMLDLFVAAGLEGRVRADHGHMYVESSDAERAIHLVSRVFGVTSVSLVYEVPTERAVITSRLLELSQSRLFHGARFAIRARRTGSHPFTSQELGRDLGGDVLDRFPELELKVDLEHPEVELFVEVRGPRTYLYFDRLPGPGGLPLGVAGRLVALVDSPRGALGAYLMMKRGCRVGFVTPTGGAALAADVLARYDPQARIVPVGDGAEVWATKVGEVAEATHADGVVLPLIVEDYPALRGRWGDRVIFSPTVGLTDAEVTERWERVVSRAS